MTRDIRAENARSRGEIVNRLAALCIRIPDIETQKAFLSLKNRMEAADTSSPDAAIIDEFIKRVLDDYVKNDAYRASEPISQLFLKELDALLQRRGA